MYDYSRIDIIELENRILNDIDSIEHPDKLITVERDSFGNILAAHFEDEKVDDLISEGYVSENTYDEYSEEENIIIIDDGPTIDKSNEKKHLPSSACSPKVQNDEYIGKSIEKKCSSPSTLEKNLSSSPTKTKDLKEISTTLIHASKTQVEPDYSSKHEYNKSLAELKTQTVELDTFSSSIKKQVRGILTYFLTTNESCHLDFDTIGDEFKNPAIGTLIRTGLCSVLLNFFTYGLNKSEGWFTKIKPGVVSHFWKIVEYCAKSKNPESKQFDRGYDLLSVVVTINEVTDSRGFSFLSRDDRNTSKFYCFICYCLNYKILPQCLQFIVGKHHQLLSQYYNPKSIILQPDKCKILLKNLTPLNELPFRLNHMS